MNTLLLLALTLNAHAALFWKASLSPSQNDLGTHYDFGNSLSTTLVFRNENANGCFTAFKLSGLSAPYSVASSTCGREAVIAPKGTCTIQIAFTTAQAGRFTDTLELQFRDSRNCTSKPRGLFNRNLSAIVAGTVIAKPPSGTADTSFGNQGTFTLDNNGYHDTLTNLFLDPQGRILATGYSNNGNNNAFLVARLTPQGTFDTGFAHQGIASLPFGPRNEQAHFLQSDPQGRLYVAGHSGFDFLVTRLLANGTVDVSYGDVGRTQLSFTPGSEESINSIAALSNSVIVGGSSFNGNQYQFALAKYLENGALDPSFGDNGTKLFAVGHNHAQLFSLVAGENQSFYAAGYGAFEPTFDFAVLKVLANGSLDSAFGTHGVVSIDFGSTTDLAFSMAKDSDGRLIVGGRSRRGDSLFYSMARLQPDGSLDKTFGTNGKISFPLGNAEDMIGSHSIDSKGRILLATYLSSSGVDRTAEIRRLTPDGNLDTSFGNQGVATTGFRNLRGRALPMAILPNHLFVGGFRFSGSSNDVVIQKFWSW